MNKLLLTAAAVAALSTSAFASEGETSSANQFYLRGDIGAAKFGQTKQKIAGVEVKNKTKFGASIDLGAGYYITDSVRAELVYTQPFGLSTKATAKIKGNKDDVTLNVKHKPTVRALLARVSGDVVDLGMAKLFLTGGLGWAQVKDKLTIDNVSVKSKNKNNLAWTVGAGAAFDVSEGVHLEAAYSWRDYGKTKKFDDEVKGIALRSHNFTAGVRFDI
jgi:opacity protein-like surface antigen